MLTAHTRTIKHRLSLTVLFVDKCLNFVAQEITPLESVTSIVLFTLRRNKTQGLGPYSVLFTEHMNLQYLPFIILFDVLYNP